MSFTQAIAHCYSNYATFSGRASRSEFWFFRLYVFLVMLLGFILIPAGIGIVILCVAALANFLPDLSVTVRRLHDTDHSGWWFWISLVPFVGIIVLLVFFCTRGSWGENRFGPDPLGSAGAPQPYRMPPRSDLAEELARLAKLRDDGTISEDEFQRLKTKLI